MNSNLCEIYNDDTALGWVEMSDNRDSALAIYVYYKDTEKTKTKNLKVDHIFMQWQGIR
jgi:hypothetical protein